MAEQTKERSIEGLYSRDIYNWLQVWADDMRSVVYRHCKPVNVWPRLLELMGRKEAEYDLSWAKRGILGYWLGCLARQQDRVDPGFYKLLTFEPQDVDTDAAKAMARSLIGTLGDVANYAVMGMCMLAVYYPDEYDDWEESITKGRE